MSPEPDFFVGPDADPDRYRLGDAVGSGGEGILYRGSITTATGLTLPVAVKMLQPRYLANLTDWQAAWGEQVELLRSLQLPGVVTVRDGFVGPLPHYATEARADTRTLYLVMNWVEGESLDDWVRRNPASPIDALNLLLPVATALDLMHEGTATGGVPVIHRDVKPSNILVTEKGTVLVDFGLTRGLPGGSRVSVVAGTPGYIAPETLTRGSYTAAVDRYALGAVVLFMLTGREPAFGERPDEQAARLRSVPSIADSEALVDQVMAMLDPDPEQRPRHLASWVSQLRRSTIPAGATIPPTPPPPVASPPPIDGDPARFLAPTEPRAPSPVDADPARFVAPTEPAEPRGGDVFRPGAAETPERPGADGESRTRRRVVLSAVAVAAAALLIGGVLWATSGSGTRGARVTAASGKSSSSSSEKKGSNLVSIPEVSNATDLTAAPSVSAGQSPAPTTLQKKDLVVGSGTEAVASNTVQVQYYGANYADGKEFDSSWKRGQPATFPLNGVIAGFKEGIVGMKVGGRRVVVIPPDLGYGAAGSPPAVGPNETLVFVIDLLAVQ